MKELKDQKLKKYFTQIPNYILESFSIWDREVYVQIKKIAGEDGICWTSQKTLAKQSGMSVNRLKESIKNLLLNKLIEKIGFRKVMTKGGPQKIPEYKIINIWEMNIKYIN